MSKAPESDVTTSLSFSGIADVETSTRSAPRAHRVDAAGSTAEFETAVEAGLRQAEERFYRLADHIPQLVWMADEFGNRYWFNRRWYDYTGTSLDEVRDSRWQEFHHPEHVERVISGLQKAWTAGDVWEDTFPLRGKDGSYRWFLSRALPIRDSSGAIQSWFGTNTDVTDLRRAKEEAEAANAAKDMFIACLSHELRAPLTSAILIAAARAESAELPQDVRQDFERIRHAIEQETKLVDDLLDVARITHGKLHLERVGCDMHRLINDAVALLGQEIHDKKLNLSLELQARCAVIACDSLRISQVLSNLLRNAIQFTPPEGRIQIRTDDAGAALHVAVADSGVGIAAKELDRIFRPLEQGERTHSYRKVGLGLGLTICKNVIEAHDGRIWPESSGEGKGATFHILLPHISTAPAK